MARTSPSRLKDGTAGLLLLLVLSSVLLVSQRDNAVTRRAAPLLSAEVQAPVAAWLSTPIRAAEQTLSTAEDNRRAGEENIVLRAELVELRAENDRLAAMRLRLRRLEALLAVEESGDIPTNRIAARVVSDPSSPFVRSLLVGAGQSSGIAEGNPVLSESGLVGHVVSAGKRSARVLQLDDLNSRVAVMSERSGARAILAGTNADQPSLAFVSDVEGWVVGDRVLTSGDDGRLPQGLPVGTVVEGERVQLDYRQTPPDWVFVLPYRSVADAGDADLPESEPETGSETEPELVVITPDADAG